jgi:ribosomal protein S18 acetylase RimI-like enzyme
MKREIMNLNETNNNFIFELGTEQDIDELGQMYDTINDYLTEGINYPGWKKGIYPVRETAVEGIEKKQLNVLRDNGKIAGSVILSHVPEHGYDGAAWNFKGGYCEILVLYTLTIHPQYHRQGIGTILMNNVIDVAYKNGIKSLRLDVYEKNTPAVGLYEKCGFEYIGKVDLGYHVYGLDWFLLYEKVM